MLHGEEAARRRHAITDSGGDGPVLLFAHGFGCDQQMWRLVVPAFAATHRVITFDHIGCGRSDVRAYDTVRHASLRGYADDVVALIEALDLHEVCLVGHSVSAMIGLQASIQRPRRFDRLVLLGPSPRYLNDPPIYHGGFDPGDIADLMDMLERNLVGWADFLAHTVAGPGADTLAQELKASFCAADPLIIRRFARATFLADSRDDLPMVSVPSLVVQMANDAVAPVDVGRYCHARLARSHYAELPVSGHMPHLTHPDMTVQLIREYLALAVLA
jgi:sigma-B regulation protein RsbQ